MPHGCRFRQFTVFWADLPFKLNSPYFTFKLLCASGSSPTPTLMGQSIRLRPMPSHGLRLEEWWKWTRPNASFDVWGGGGPRGGLVLAIQLENCDKILVSYNPQFWSFLVLSSVKELTDSWVFRVFKDKRKVQGFLREVRVPFPIQIYFLSVLS